MEFKNLDQLKSFLKKESKRLGISINNTYSTFFSRILLQHLSSYGYDELLVKGSFSELAHLNTMVRPITDVDLVSTKEHNDPLLILYRAMYETNSDIFFELADLPKKTKTGIYKLNIIANYDKIKHPISIDFQELSNTVYEKENKKISSVFVGDSDFYMWTPSYEEHLAEKLCIVVESNKDNVLNTRVKDFYDIYKLCSNIYDTEKLSYFFYHMLKDRNKTDIGKVSVNHLNNLYIMKHQELWNAMSKKYDFLDKTIEFSEVVEFTRQMISEEIKNIDSVKSLKIRLK